MITCSGVVLLLGVWGVLGLLWVLGLVGGGGGCPGLGGWGVLVVGSGIFFVVLVWVCLGLGGVVGGWWVSALGFPPPIAARSAVT